MDLFGYQLLSRLNLVVVRRLAAMNRTLIELLNKPLFWQKHLQYYLKVRLTIDVIRRLPVSDPWRCYAIINSPRTVNLIKRTNSSVRLSISLTSNILAIPSDDDCLSVIDRDHDLLLLDFDEHSKVVIQKKIAKICNMDIIITVDGEVMIIRTLPDDDPVFEPFMIQNSALPNHEEIIDVIIYPTRSMIAESLPHPVNFVSLKLMVTSFGRLLLVTSEKTSPKYKELELPSPVMKVIVMQGDETGIEGLVSLIDGSLWHYRLENDQLTLVTNYQFPTPVIDLKGYATEQRGQISLILTNDGRLSALEYDYAGKFTTVEPIRLADQVKRFDLNEYGIYLQTDQGVLRYRIDGNFELNMLPTPTITKTEVIDIVAGVTDLYLLL